MILKKRLFLSLLILSSALPAHGFGFKIPTAESIRQAITDNKFTTYGLAGTAALTAAAIAAIKTYLGCAKIDDPSLYWDWNNIDATAISFPQEFIFGAGTSA